ncbi:MAG: phosphoglucosamine mutase [Nitrososphaerota archaeon]|nr:phosphoglucosamine mutase [Nitrososphaerota archaeon]
MPAVSRKYFGTNGIRGIPGRDLTLEFVAEMAQSIGTYFGKSKPVLVGHDVRNSSPALSKTVLSGVLSSGDDANEGGLAPTPAHQYAVRTLGYGGGIIVTASHNPAQYNGIKVVGPDGVEVKREDEASIESIFLEKKYNRAEWKSVGMLGKETRVVENYIRGIVSQVNATKIAERKFTVVLDVGNGAQAVAAPYLCERLGCKVITINGQADGNFPGRGPEPTPYVLKDMSEAVVSYHADFGVAYDGDGDRSLFCDEEGKIYWGDRTGSMLVDHLLNKHPGGPVATTVSTSQLVGIVASQHSASTIWTTVGSVDVSRAMIDNKAPLGLEENGGFFYGPHIPVRDGAMTTALVLEALSYSGLSFGTRIGNLETFYQKKAKFECPNEKKTRVMQELESKGSKGKVDRTDGLKIWTDEHSWILLRPSGTEPLIRVYAESDDESKLEALYQQFEGLVKDAIGR